MCCEDFKFILLHVENGGPILFHLNYPGTLVKNHFITDFSHFSLWFFLWISLAKSRSIFFPPQRAIFLKLILSNVFLFSLLLISALIYISFILLFWVYFAFSSFLRQKVINLRFPIQTFKTIIFSLFLLHSRSFFTILFHHFLSSQSIF